MSTSKTSLSPKSNFISTSLSYQCQGNAISNCGESFAQLERNELRQHECVQKAVETTAVTAKTGHNICAKTREEIRREKNRIKSRKARKRKKCMIEELEKSLKVAVAHNRELRQENAQLERMMAKRVNVEREKVLFCRTANESSLLQEICPFGSSYELAVPDGTISVTEQLRGKNGMFDKKAMRTILDARLYNMNNIPISCHRASTEQDLLEERASQAMQTTMRAGDSFAGNCDVHVPISSRRRLNQESSVRQSSVANFLLSCNNPLPQYDAPDIIPALRHCVSPTILLSDQTNRLQQLFKERSRLFGSSKGIPDHFVSDQADVTKKTSQGISSNVHVKRSCQRRL